MPNKYLKIVSQTGRATVNDIVASLVYATRDGHGDSVIVGVETETLLLDNEEIEFTVLYFGSKEDVNVPAETTCAPSQ